mmetsp:Transcript_11583/g.48499  ORF Transcript_11583/g.48499 Transcript_11583/m.48499 type:complete len:215 (-) Transcript_11583:462-1106(-)
MWCREYLFPSTFMGQFSVAYSSLPAFHRRTVFTTRMKTRTHHTKHIEMVCREAPKKSAKHVNARFLCEYKLGNTQTDRLLSLVGRKGVPWLVFAGVNDGASASCLDKSLSSTVRHLNLIQQSRNTWSDPELVFSPVPAANSQTSHTLYRANTQCKCKRCHPRFSCRSHLMTNGERAIKHWGKTCLKRGIHFSVILKDFSHSFGRSHCPMSSPVS